MFATTRSSWKTAASLSFELLPLIFVLGIFVWMNLFTIPELNRARRATDAECETLGGRMLRGRHGEPIACVTKNDVIPMAGRP